MKNKYILFTLSFCFIVYNSQATTYYVKTGGNNSSAGTSWSTAKADLQYAINLAVNTGDEVWIAAGTYKPTHLPSTGGTSTSSRDLSFYLDEDIKIYGGFAGTETALSQRNSTSNPVILSGDLGGNSPTTITDDCYHVFITDRLSSAAVLDGVTITYGNGNASGSSSITYSGQTIYKKFGGGMYNISSSPTLTNVTISGNTANHAGGGMYNYSSSPILTNVTISGNTVSTYHGGGIYNDLSSPTLTNVTISGNTANGMGGGIFNFQSGSSPTIINTIFWGNAKGTSAATNVAGADIENANSATVTITYSLVQLASSSYTSGNNNLLTTNTNMIYNTDPSFVNSSDPDGADNVWMTADDGLNINYSPAYHTGTSSGAPTTDITGEARGSSPSMGAYEGYILRLYVDKDATGTGDGTSWTDAFTTLQPALNAASAGDSIFIAEGTYKPTLDPSSGTASGNTRDYAFYLDKDIKIYGGFAGTETALSQRNSTSNPVILSGDLGGNSPTTITDDCYHVFITDGLSSAAVLDGVTITYGNANGSSSISYSGQTYDQNRGGGMFNIASSPSLSNVIISDSYAATNAGGMYNSSSSPALTNVTINGNTGGTDGGGMFNISSSNPTLTNVTISGNTAPYNGGGLTNWSNSSCTIKNSIFWGNTKGTSTTAVLSDIYVSSSSTATISYSLVQLASSSYTSGNNNALTSATNMVYATDPSFINASDPDGADNVWMTADDGLNIINYSPAYHTGTSSGAPTTDITGEARGSSPSMGAYEGVVITILYVDKDATSGLNNGSSWTNAFTTLQPALNIASAGDSIWIAEGTYKPTLDPSSGTASGNTRDYAFYLDKDIKIYGGFAGTETALSQRNSTSNPVILSGDLGGNSPTTITDDCYHVFITDGLSSAAVLDGVTITYGNANGSSSISYSGLTFDRDKGGGLYVTIISGYTSPTLEDVIINYNTAAFGGGMYNAKSSASLTGLNIHNNTSTNKGGGMYNYDSPLTLAGVTIENNSCVNEGGGMNNQYSGNITITETYIAGNTADEGGGMYNGSSSSTTTLTNVTISGNTASTHGGGIMNTGTSTTALTNVIISGNSAGNSTSCYGGGILNTGTSTITLTNVIISGNSANSGGGITNNGSNLTIMNASIYGNAATIAGGGLINIGTPTITNTIFWGNTQGGNASVAGADIYNASGTVTITYSLTQENSSYSTGTGMINNQDPLFLNASDPDGADNSWMTKDDGLNMYDISPAFHTGTSSGAPTTDITGTTRGSSPSMGAYEGDITIFFADKDATGSNDGSSWTDAYTTLQPALNAASAGDEVWIASGTYNPAGYPTGVTSTNTRDYSFYLDKDIKIYGGFAGTETPLSPRNIASNPVILSGDLGSNSPTTITDDCYHVFITDGLSAAAVLDGVTITYGNANGSSTISYSGQTYNQTYGGGIYNIASSPTISNVTFLNNIASDGGGIYNNSSSNPTLNNLNIISNSASNGGGIYTNDSLSLVNCNVLFNSASTNGGGIYNNAATSTTTTLKNSIFFGNGQSSASNRSAAGADIYFANAVPVTATNSMMQLAAIGSYTSGTKNQINTSTSNLFAVYPSFMDTTDLNGTDNAWMTYDDGLRLGTGSSAIAAGTATGAPSTDLIGEDRPSPPAIGAYEGIYCTSSKTLPTTVSTTYTSSYKSTDTNGWTNYCDASDKLLLSLDIGSSGAVIAKNAVKLKLGASTVYTSTSTGGLITNSGGYSLIDRRWSVVPTTQPSNGNVGVRSYFTAAEVSALNTALSSSSVYNSFDDLQMFKAQTNVTGGGTATAFADPHTVNGIVLINGGTASTTVWEDGTHGTSDHFAEFEVSSFSGGGGGGGANGAPLPVELVYFEAKAIDNHQALLNWQTASELNNNYFDVERSYDAIHWEWVGKVAGNGTTTQLTDYSFVDKTIAKSQQTAYYRLNQIDYDGANEYTDIRSVRFTVKPNAFEIAAYPNPFNQEVTISVNTTELYSIEVTDLSGILLLAIQNEDKGTHRLDLSAWASGVYIVNVTSTQGTKHLKVIKQ